EYLEMRRLLAFTAAEIQYDWSHASAAAVADLKTIIAGNPTFGAELSADLAGYGVSLTDVLGATVTVPVTVQPAAALAAPGVRTRRQHGSHASRTPRHPKHPHTHVHTHVAKSHKPHRAHTTRPARTAHHRGHQT